MRYLNFRIIRNNGKVEYWKKEVSLIPIIPFFHYSNALMIYI
jgi:hypothetical protein